MWNLSMFDIFKRREYAHFWLLIISFLMEMLLQPFKYSFPAFVLLWSLKYQLTFAEMRMDQENAHNKKQIFNWRRAFALHRKDQIEQFASISPYFYSNMAILSNGHTNEHICVLFFFLLSKGMSLYFFYLFAWLSFMATLYINQMYFESIYKLSRYSRSKWQTVLMKCS